MNNFLSIINLLLSILLKIKIFIIRNKDNLKAIIYSFLNVKYE